MPISHHRKCCGPRTGFPYLSRWRRKIVETLHRFLSSHGTTISKEGRKITKTLFRFQFHYKKIGEFQQRHWRLSTLWHGPSHDGRNRSFQTIEQFWLHGEQLRRWSRQTLRVPEIGRSYSQDRRLGFPGRQHHRWLPSTMPHRTLPLPLFRLRWHWRECLPTEPSRFGHFDQHSGIDFFSLSVDFKQQFQR